MTIPAITSALTIASTDSGGGAGIQADLKTFAAHHIYGISIAAALTAQNTQGVLAIHVPPINFLQAQIKACFDDFHITAVKLGMLANAEVIHAVADALEHYKPAYIVLDPVMIATSGDRLLEENALHAMRTRLIPLASLLTPNIPEAELLLGHSITDANNAEAATAELLALGSQAVLLKGGHLSEGNRVIDRFDNGVSYSEFTHTRLPQDAHGTGCTLASAITAQLCHGLSMEEACKSAIDYIARALNLGFSPGRGAVRVLDHIGAMQPINND